MSSSHTSIHDNDFRTLFTVLSVSWTANKSSIQFVVPKLVICLLIAFVFYRDETFINTLFIGLIYSILLISSLLLHILGHIISSKFVAPAMTECRIKPQLIETRYDNDSELIAPSVHIIRSIGGPLMNLFLGFLSLIMWFLTHYDLALFVALANFIFMTFVLLPLPTVDGEVIWREVFKLVREK